LSLALDFFLPPKLNIPMAGRYSTPSRRRCKRRRAKVL
jgi:hypothetical protein